jgi:hypothetical protein
MISQDAWRQTVKGVKGKKAWFFFKYTKKECHSAFTSAE